MKKLFWVLLPLLLLAGCAGVGELPEQVRQQIISGMQK